MSWLVSIITVPRRLRQKDHHQFQDSLAAEGNLTEGEVGVCEEKEEGERTQHERGKKSLLISPVQMQLSPVTAPWKERKAGRK